MGLLLERWNGAWGQEKQSSLALPWLYLALRAQPFRAFLSRGEHEGGACAHSPLERAQPREAILEPMSDAREHSGGWILVLRGRARGLMQVEESGCTRLWSFPKDYSCPDWGLVLADTSLRRKEPERALVYMFPASAKSFLLQTPTRSLPSAVPQTGPLPSPASVSPSPTRVGTTETLGPGWLRCVSSDAGNLRDKCMQMGMQIGISRIYGWPQFQGRRWDSGGGISMRRPQPGRPTKSWPVSAP